MTGSMAEAVESEDDRRAILEGFRALQDEVTVWSLTCEAKGRLDDDDEADETESDRDEGQIEGRLGVFATGRRGPDVYEHETPRWVHRVHESLSPSHLAFLERQASHAWRTEIGEVSQDVRVEVDVERELTWTVRSFLSTSEERVRKNPVSLHRSATEAVAGRKGVEETQPAPRGSDEDEGIASVPAQRGEGRVSF